MDDVYDRLIKENLVDDTASQGEGENSGEDEETSQNPLPFIIEKNNSFAVDAITGNSEEAQKIDLAKKKIEALKEQWYVNENCNLHFKDLVFEEMKPIAKEIRSRIRPKSEIDTAQDYRILTTGGTGVGKSIFALYFGVLCDHDFDLIKNVAYFEDANRIVDKFESINQFGYLLVDEAIKSMDKFDYAKKEFRQIVQMYNTERWQGKITNLVIPSINHLATTILENEIDMWVHIYMQGHAVVMFKRRMFGSVLSFTDAWKGFAELVKKKKQHLISPEDVVRCFSKSPTFLCRLDNIPHPRQYEKFVMEYERLKKLSRKIARATEEFAGYGVTGSDNSVKDLLNKRVAKTLERRTDAFVKVLKILMNDSKYSYSDLERFTGYDVAYIHKLVKGTEYKVATNV